MSHYFRISLFISTAYLQLLPTGYDIAASDFGIHSTLDESPAVNFRGYCETAAHMSCTDPAPQERTL